MSNILKGKLGWKGEKGDSAYEISVKHGYTGTEEQWSEDFLNADNYYDKPEMNTKLADYKLLGDFAVITGIIDNTEEQADVVQITGIEYPEGFTIDNCVVINTSFERLTGSRVKVNGSRHTLISFTSGAVACEVDLTTNSIMLVARPIYLRAFDPDSPDAPQVQTAPMVNCKYTIVLMKIPTTEEGE